MRRRSGRPGTHRQCRRADRNPRPHCASDRRCTPSRMAGASPRGCDSRSDRREAGARSRCRPVRWPLTPEPNAPYRSLVEDSSHMGREGVRFWDRSPKPERTIAARLRRLVSKRLPCNEISDLCPGTIVSLRPSDIRLSPSAKMDILLQDVRYAGRKLLRSPGFTVVAVATLALAIGATTAVFSIVNGVLLKPLPYRAPDELVKLGSRSKTGTLVHLSVPDFIDYRDQTHSFVAVAQVQDGNSANLRVADGDAVRLSSAAVGARFFELLGTPMELGHGFARGDDEKGARPVVVIAHKLWRQQFASDPQIVGRVVSLNGVDRTIVGVASPSVTYMGAPDLWTPFVFESWMTDPDNRGAHFISAIARLRPGVTIEQADRDMRTVGERLRSEYPKSNSEFGGIAQGLRKSIVGDVGALLYTLLGAVGFVLLIACANIANLLLVRASGRETEIAVRTALGAGRGRIVRQLITESLLIAAAGAAVGGAMAAWAVDAIVAFGPRGLPRIDDIGIDPRVLGF